jgi:hypothetical protein
MTLFGLSEPVIRLLAFSTIFIALAAIELLAPRLERDEMRGALKSRRWMTNLAMVVLSSVALQGCVSRWPRSAPRFGRNPMVSACCRFSVYRSVACRHNRLRPSRFRGLARTCGQPQMALAVAHPPHAPCRYRV